MRKRRLPLWKPACGRMSRFARTAAGRNASAASKGQRIGQWKCYPCGKWFTARFGTDPESSVLDLDCRAHDLDNLYIADASFFPSIGAVNPTLTIIANALRVADRIKERLE